MCRYVCIGALSVLLGFASFGALCTYWVIDEYRSDRGRMLRWNREAGRWQRTSK